MSAHPKSDYTPGQSINFQALITKEQHEEFKRQAKEAGLGLKAYFLALIAEKQTGTTIQMRREEDSILPDNRDIHKRFEVIWNSLNKIEREALEGVLDRFSPKLKGKRAS